MDFTDGFHSVRVRDCSVKNDSHDTLYVKDMTVVLRKQVKFEESGTSCSSRSRKRHFQKFFFKFDYGLHSNVLKRRKENVDAILLQLECVD